VITTLAAVRSELTKIFTLPSVLVLSAVLLALHVAVQLFSLSLFAEAVAGIDSNGMIEIFKGERLPAVQEMTEQLVAAMFTPVPLVPVVSAVIAGSEFRTGQIGSSITAIPSRVRLVAAKAVATALFAVALCVSFAVLTTVVMYSVVADWKPDILVSSSVLEGYLSATLIAVCATLIALGVTMLTRRALMGILVMALMLGFTISQVMAAVSPAVDAVLPISAARNLLFYNSRDIAPPLTSGPGTAVVVLLLWAVVAVAASVTIMTRRDAR
jgi:hypothetical protein